MAPGQENSSRLRFRTDANGRRVLRTASSARTFTAEFGMGIVFSNRPPRRCASQLKGVARTGAAGGVGLRFSWDVVSLVQAKVASIRFDGEAF